MQDCEAFREDAAAGKDERGHLAERIHGEEPLARRACVRVVHFLHVERHAREGEGAFDDRVAAAFAAEEKGLFHDGADATIASVRGALQRVARSTRQARTFQNGAR